MVLSTNPAPDGEPIPAPRHDDDLTGPDMREVMPIAEMIADLRRFDTDFPAYAERWGEFHDLIGGYVDARIEADGTRHLTVGLPCDIQARHRALWSQALCVDLKSDLRRREALIDNMIGRWRYIDDRPVDTRRIIAVLRDYLRVGGRILIDPDGALRDGGIPNSYYLGSPKENEACAAACRAYLELRCHWQPHPHIKRVARMLGKQTKHGWWVLESEE